jgi:hypothetical protein
VIDWDLYLGVGSVRLYHIQAVQSLDLSSQGVAFGSVRSTDST